jgi:hypothetical protein
VIKPTKDYKMSKPAKIQLALIKDTATRNDFRKAIIQSELLYKLGKQTIMRKNNNNSTEGDE